MKPHYAERTYAGVLGKIIGVYLGRPVEGWPYEAIEERFGEVDFYIHEAVGAPLIVADDDISGTFGFYRAVEESGYANPLTPEHVGEAWLNAIVPDKTILWWGGLGRSTEHTAWLRLKAGIPAPDSGSIARNGSTIAEQIGAQIFMDAFAMTCPGDPERAAHMVRAAASVSHDGLAVEAAALLGAMEALAYDEHNLDALLDAALLLTRDTRLHHLVDDIRTICQGETNWRRARATIDSRYGYHLYPGPCHIVPNHAMVLASLLLGGDNFQRSIMIAATAAWDTDCNAGNVGCLNAIRLGLDALTSGADLRTPVADRMYVVTADGGSCITDAVQQTRRILRAAALYAGETPPAPAPRFAFDFPGARQGFSLCPSVPQPNPVLTLNETHRAQDAAAQSQPEAGLLLTCRGLAQGVRAAISTPVSLDFGELAQNFATIGSPTLYPTQTITAHVRAFDADTPLLRFYLFYADRDDHTARVDSDPFPLTQGVNSLHWTLPPLDGMPIVRLGMELLPAPERYGRRYDCRLALLDLDWSGAPAAFEQRGMLMRSIWNLAPNWLRAWVSSARHFAPDFKYTYCISHPEAGGVVTLGTSDWRDYSVSSQLAFSLHKAGGLVLRSQGHRRYYAALLSGGNTLSLLRRIGPEERVLASCPFAYDEDRLYSLAFSAQGSRLHVAIDGITLLEVDDPASALDPASPLAPAAMLASGGAGFLIDSGTMLANGFAVHALPSEARQ